MIIPLTDKYRVKTDSRNFIVDEVFLFLETTDTHEEGEPYYKPLAYFGDMDNLVRWLITHELLAQTGTFTEAMEYIDLFMHELKGALNAITKKWKEEERSN